MKFLEKYLEEKERIKPLGKLTTKESVEGESVGVSLVIDGYEPGIEVWWADYAMWLEEKIEIPFQQIVIHRGDKVASETQFYAHKEE